MSQRTGGCHTCFGTGEIVGEFGALRCPDCYGEGRTDGAKTFEWRLLDIERAVRAAKHETLPDVAWLIHEVRQSRSALMEILTRCQDAAPGDETALAVRSTAMRVLGLHQHTKVDS